MAGFSRARSLAASTSILSVLGASILASPAGAQTQVERGAYLVTIMDCGGCHTTGNLVGKPDPARYLGGSDIGWLIPGLGIFYPSNLTPHATGIGDWSTADIVRLLKTGVTPEGREVAPMMPWRAYAKATDADLEAIAAYLKTVGPVDHTVPGPTSVEAVKTPYFTVAPSSR